MSEILDTVLQDAARFESGALAIGHLRRQNDDRWDSLVVGKDGQPLMFWAAGPGPDVTGLVTREDGSYLMVVVATPPGVEPRGLIELPAEGSGSPLMKLRTLVTTEGHTIVSGDVRDKRQPPPPGRDMLRSLLDQAAAQRGDEYAVAEVETADGGSTKVLLDWDERPLLFWIEMPGEERKRELMAAVAADDGLVAMAVDARLRPLYSAVP